MFPEELPRRCIAAGCPVGGTVLDLFLAAPAQPGSWLANLGRRSVLIELNESYCEDGRTPVGAAVFARRRRSVNDRMTAAQFRAQAAAKPKAHGSKRGDNRDHYPKVCKVCGGRVTLAQSAQRHTDCVTGVLTVWHIGQDACR